MSGYDCDCSDELIIELFEMRKLIEESLRMIEENEKFIKKCYENIENLNRDVDVIFKELNELNK